MTVRRSARTLALLSACVCAGVALSCSLFACSSDDDAQSGGDPDVDAIAWVSPAPSADGLHVDDPIELTVKVNDARATAVRFAVDGKPLATCDGTQAEQDCRTGDLFRWTTTFSVAGRHHLVASYDLPAGDGRSAALDVDVLAKGADEPDDLPDASLPDGAKLDAAHDGATLDAGKDAGPVTPPVVNRGFLDPDRGLHNVFGGVSWSVGGQKVTVTAPPTGASIAAIAACMAKYGASIRKHGDAYKVSRGSVIATAITESNCTNPSGSSDGLSSGPMQVTGSTCAAVAGGGISASACKTKMFTSPDFSFQIGAKYMGSSYQVGQHAHDPPKIGAAYNAGSIRQSSANRWHMIVTGNHIERFVAAYNAYRAWEATTIPTKLALEIEVASRPATFFDGEHVATAAELPSAPPEGQVYFVGDWAARTGAFVTFRGGRWENDLAPSP